MEDSINIDQPRNHDNNAASANNYEDLFPALPSGGGLPASAGSMPVQRADPIMRVSSSKVTQVFEVPYGERKFENEKFGEGESVRTCQTIMKETGAHIEISSGKDQSLTFLVSGKPNEVQLARRQILVRFQTQASKTVNIPREHHRWILGKKGERLRDLEKATATKINVPNVNEDSDKLTITGTKEGIEKAEHKLRTMSDEQSKRAFERIEVPKVLHPFIIGPHNETVNQITADTGARVNIPPASVQNDELTVTGEKEGVLEAVRRITAIRREMEKKCTTVSIEVPRAQHKYVIGPRGTTLQDILKETGVSVEVPPTDNNSDTITLRGPSERLGNALSLVYQKANSVRSTVLEVPHWIHKYIIGKKGDRIRNFNKEFSNVHIEFTDNQIKMDGPPEQLDPAAEQLERMCNDYIQNYVFDEMVVDPRHYKHIIGKGGANIKAIRGDHDVTINIDEKDGQNRIRLEGTQLGVTAAKTELLDIIKKLENEKERDIIIDHRHFRNIIGTKGERIREIREKFNQVQITFPGPNEKTDIVKIRGPKEDVDNCYKEMNKIVKELQASSFEMKVPIFKQFHKYIIGKGGVNIKRIREETQTKIDLPQEGDKNELIVITGKKENVLAARDQIQKVQEDMANIVTEEISIPAKYHNSLIGSGGRLINSIMEECGNVSIKFPTAETKSDKVVIRGPKDDVERAKVTLVELSNEKKLSSFTAEVKANPQHHKFLIGKNGGSIKKIREQTGARIMFPTAEDEDKETITIVGKKEAVEQAKVQLEAIIKDIGNITEDEINIDPKYHKHFVARRGEVLQRIADEYGGVMISFPRAGTDSDRVTLKGSKDCIDAAKQRLLEIVSDIDAQVTIDCVIPQKHHRNVMGTRGNKIQAIIKEYDVNIKFPERDTGYDNGMPHENGDTAENGVRTNDVIRITGRKEKCEAARQALLDSVPVTKEMNVKFDLHRLIIGKQGRDIRELMSRYDVHIELSPPSEQLDIIRVTGAPGTVDEAIAALKERVQQIEEENKDRDLRSFQLSIDVDNKYHTKIIGQGGVVVNKIRNKHNVQISLPDRTGKKNPDQDINVIIIKGYEDAAKAAADEILAIVHEIDNLFKKTITIDARIHNRLVGQRGRHVRQIMDEFKVQIDFPRSDGADPNLVTVYGDEENVENCCDHLLILEEEYMQDVEGMAMPSGQQQTYTEIFEKTFNKNHAQPKEGFVVANAPWEKKRGGRGGYKNNQQQEGNGEAAPNTASHEDFPGFGAEPVPNNVPAASGPWTQYR